MGAASRRKQAHRTRPTTATMSMAEYHHLRARMNGHPELVALLELIYRRDGLAGLTHLTGCLLCGRPSEFACVGVFIPTTPGAIRKARWLVWSHRRALNGKPMFVYSTCATCARTHAHDLGSTVERALLARADVLMSKAGLAPNAARRVGHDSACTRVHNSGKNLSMSPSI